MIIVSECLAGIKCRYDANSKPCQKVIDLVKDGKAVLVCPEQLGGLPTPRPAAEQVGDYILTKEGKDVTMEFNKGAEEALKIAELSGAKEAILKSNSPSCGFGKVYDGTFSGTLKEGDGVFAKLLKEKGFKIRTEKEL